MSAMIAVAFNRKTQNEEQGGEPQKDHSSLTDLREKLGVRLTWLEAVEHGTNKKRNLQIDKRFCKRKALSFYGMLNSTCK